jgi:hypothetical protein
MPFQYSFEENTEMLLIFGECGRDATLAAETYAARFPQNRAPNHQIFKSLVSSLRETKYKNWIGRGGPIPWPARSPDLTPPDFFLWGAIKERVFRERPTTRDNMRKRLITAFREFNDLNVAATVQANFKRRLRLCIEQEGHHFEHLM